MQVSLDSTAEVNAHGRWCPADAAVATAAALNVCEPSMTGKLVIFTYRDHPSKSGLQVSVEVRWSPYLEGFQKRTG